MLLRCAAAVSLTFCLGLAACASSGGGGDLGEVSVAPDGVLMRGGAPRSDMAFLYADRGCMPLSLDGNRKLDLLGNPQKIVRTNDYIGTAIYAVAPGSHTLMVRSVVAATSRKMCTASASSIRMTASRCSPASAAPGTPATSGSTRASGPR